MRKLFTTFIALCATMAMSAQDTSGWQPEQEVTEDLLWQNTKFEGDKSGWESAGGAGIGWFYEPDKAKSGSIEMFQNPTGAECYQVFWLPAGYYRFTVQGFYRPNNWGNNFTDEFAVFFCDAVTETEVETEDGEIIYEYTATRQTSKPLRHITSDAYQGDTRLFEKADDWQQDSGWEKDGMQYWVPNSMWGTSLYFDTDRYENEMYVINTEDGYVKIGIRKTGEAGSDWTIFNNFRAYYISDAGEAVQLLLAQDNVLAAEAKVSALQDKIANEYGSLAALLGDELISIQESSDYNNTIAECEATIAKYDQLIAQYNQHYSDAKVLSSLLVKCKTLSDKSGDATLAAAVAAASAIEQDGNGDNEMTIDAPEAYKQAADALSQARVNYIMSQPAVNGAWDFTNMVKSPWFCNEEHNPTWNEELGYYEYAEGVEDVWIQAYGEKGIPDIMKEHPDWSNITSNVSWTSKKDAEGEWIFNHNITSGWMGGIDNVTVQHGYTAVGAWSADPCGGYQEMRQVITGLPNGYYSMGAYFINAGAQPLDYNQYVYINPGTEPNDETMETARFTHMGTHWWTGTDMIPVWRTDDWQDLRTNFVKVENGTCVIGSRSNGFYAVTGFRLFYYGENPDFTAMIKPEIEEVKAIELRLAGDIAHVAALLASLPETINGYDEYVAARNIVEEAKAYANASVAYMATWDASDKFMELQSNYDEGTDEYAMLDPTWYKTLSFEEEPDATYLGAQAISNDYNAYVNYFSTRNEMMKVADANAELKALLEQQCAEIKNAYTTAATFESYIAALSAPYNVAILASLGVDKATEANPVDITQLLNNPSFDEGKNGWEGDFTADANYKNAEVYNTNSFRVAQTIYNLPAGSYRVQVQSFYRDGGSAQDAYNNLYAEELAAFYEDETMAEKSYSANVKLFANYNATDVVSIASEKFFEPSMTERIDKWEEDLEATEAYHDEHFNDPDYDPEYKVMKPVYVYIDMISPAYPFDQNMYDEADSFEEIWYPNSMEGAMNRFQKNPAAYINTVDVSITETGNLTFGLEKLEGIGSDWCIFDNFKLFCISTDPAVGINSVADTKAAATSIYTVNGIRQNTLTRGINIVKTSDGTVKKVVK